MSYAGQRAVVVGASGSIGRAIALELLENGCDAALTYHRDRDAALELARRAEELGRRCFAYRLDLRERERVRSVCQRAVDELGPPGIVVVTAGVVRDRPVIKMAEGDWSEVVETNLAGPFQVVRQLVPVLMRNGGGRIVTVSSVSGLAGQPGQASYAAAKGGLIAMTRSLARELGPFKITVNSIAPGFVESKMTTGLSDSFRRRALERIPLRRFARAEEIVPVARLLMAADGAYVTGQVVVVDGGLTS